MSSKQLALDPKPSRPSAGFDSRILRLVKNAPERQAIASGQVDAVIDRASGKVFLLPDAQHALREDQARVRCLLALSADWCWDQDESYRFVSHTDITAGNSAPYGEGVAGKLLRDLPFDNMKEADWQAHQRLLEWRFPFRDLELRCTDRAGEMHWVSVSGEPVFDGQERFKGYRGTARDITFRKQSEALAQVAREKLTERMSAEQHAEQKSGKSAARAAASRKNIVEHIRQERLLGPWRHVATGDSIANGLLAALPVKDYQGLLAGLEAVTLTYGDVLFEPGEPIRHVYFPNDSFVSLLTTVEGREALEVGLVGREGVVGVSLALGVDISSVRALVQGSGTAMRMESARFHEEFRQCEPLQRALLRYAHAKLVQARQTAACNRFHVVEARLARWLLMTRDRARSSRFLLTQEFLADMLGVRRVAVTKAAGALQRRKLIRYSRGKISILDQKGLEAASCGCYRIIENMLTQERG